jgi:lambda family phage portal protein
MGFFDVFKSKPKRAGRSLRSYAAANSGRLFADFGASANSADSELKSAISILRDRSRDLARNNEFAKRYLGLLKNNVIGDVGFNLQVKALSTNGAMDALGNQEVERGFAAWGKKGNCTTDGTMSWRDCQLMAMESLARDGEFLIVTHQGSRFNDSIALEFLEVDQLDHELNQAVKEGKNEIRMGVEVDKFKKPIAYHILVSHPNDEDYSTYSRKKHRRVPASQVIHGFLKLRAGQTRGEPWMAPVIPALKQIGALREAAVINARVGASKMGFFTSSGGDGFVPDDLDGDVPIMDADPGTFHQLPTGVDFKSFDPAYPSNEFEAFHKVVMKGIAAGLGVSYTALASDLEATSYSSIRQGALEERDNYRGIQKFLEDHFIRPVFELWLRSSMEFGHVTLPTSTFDKFSGAATFRAKTWSWVDPVKEMNAAVTGLQHGVLSLQDVSEQYGKDVEELLAQIKKDKELAQQFGISYALEPYGASFSQVEPEVSKDD